MMNTAKSLLRKSLCSGQGIGHLPGETWEEQSEQLRELCPDKQEIPADNSFLSI